MTNNQIPTFTVPDELQDQTRSSERDQRSISTSSGHDADSLTDSPNYLERKNTIFEWGKLKLRRYDDGEDEDWWFASTAIPLIAATLGPLANMLSIAALVSSWRESLVPPDNADGPLLPQLEGISYPDPKWCYDLNIASLVCGFVGNFFLLLNFTNRIRYIIALPVTIFLWYVATAILMGIELSMNIYVPPHRPEETYTQAFWHGVIAASLYMVCSMLLMVNMLGYFTGHYGQHFNLTESQRTLILQTMMFFLYLAGGAAIFQAIEEQYGTGNWSFSDSLYFCDVTILTVGFGDLTPTNDIGRGLLFPYAVGGIISLGLVVSSLSSFAGEMSRDYVVRARLETQRKHKLERTQSRMREIAEMNALHLANGNRLSISSPFNSHRPSRAVASDVDGANMEKLHRNHKKKLKRSQTLQMMKNPKTIFLKPQARKARRHSTDLLREEKQRFDAMREIQRNNSRFKRWTALAVSVSIFALLWCLGALVFFEVEKNVQSMSYFEALYFCWVSLLTIGYGDFAPQSNAGRPFFVVWSLLAVPSMTILVSNMADTVIASITKATNSVADFTILPKYGIWRAFLESNPWLLGWLERWHEARAARKRVNEGFEVGPDPAVEAAQNTAPTLDQLAKQRQENVSEHELAKQLSNAIARVAKDFRNEPHKKYSYEEWAEFTELIKFTSRREESEEDDEDDEGLIDWDWIGPDSPMMTLQAESHWVLDRLCESMTRYTNHQVKRFVTPDKTDEGNSVEELEEEGITVNDRAYET